MAGAILSKEQYMKDLIELSSKWIYKRMYKKQSLSDACVIKTQESAESQGGNKGTVFVPVFYGFVQVI